MSSTGDAGHLQLRLFIEGIEVPVIGGVVNIGVGAPSSCSLQIVPIDRALEFLPRTLVHLFYYDFTADDLEEFAGTELEGEDLFFLKYKLLFSGEMVATQEAQTHGSRQIILQCLDFSMYWDTAYQYMMTYGPNGSGILGSPARFLGANTYLFDDIINDPVSVASGIISTGKPRTPGLKDVPGLMGGIIRLLESMGGVWYTDESELRVRGINDFFTLAELRLKLLQQMGAEQGDNTAQQMFAGKVFSQWLNNSLGGGGGLMSYRDLLKLVFSYIYYDVVPNPAPYFEPQVQTTTNGTKTEFTARRGDGRDARLFADMQNLRDVINELLTLFFEATAGSYDPNSTQGTYAEALASVGVSGPPPTQGTVPDSQITSIPPVLSLNLDQKLNIAVKRIADECFELATGPGAGYFTSAGGRMREAQTLLLSVSEGVIGRGGFASSATFEDVKKLRDIVQAAMDDIRNAWNLSQTSPHAVTQTHLARMYTQIFRPDIWMCAPPRCNVWFPENYSSFTFQRNHMREPTRLQMATSMEIVGPDPLLDYYYFAPAVDAIRGKDGVTASEEKVLLMDHEIYSGIVPKFSRMSEVGFFANKAQKQLLDSTSRSYRSVFAQRAAHFNFFKYRFNSRALQVSGKFNPHPVCGLPALVIRRGLTLPSDFDTELVLDLINAGAVELELGQGVTGETITLPSQYLGMTSSLSHAVNQRGGTTTANFSYCRVHRTRYGEDDEYLQLKREEPKNRRFRSFYKATDVVDQTNTPAFTWMRKLSPQSDAEPPPEQRYLGSTGPLGGRITEIQHSDEFGQVFLADGSQVRLYLTIEVVEELGEGDFPETITVEKPFEEQIRPNWFSPIYSNDRIGPDFYAKLLGVGSVVDDVESSSGTLTDTVIVAQGVGSADENLNAPDPESNPEIIDVGSGTNSEVRQALEATRVVAEQTVSMAKAVDFLSVLYGSLKGQDHDVLKFVTAYTKRPIARMIDVLGSPDLQFNEDGSVAQGTEGFHSRAFGPYEDCDLLLGDADKQEQFQRLEGRDKKAVDLSSDPRLGRWERVNAYRQELLFSRGLRG